MYQKFYSTQWFYKNSNITVFAIVKIATNCASLERFGNLDAYLFNMFYTFKISEIFAIFFVVQHQLFKLHEEMQNSFSNKTFLKIQFTTKIAQVRIRPIFGCKINFKRNF